MTLRNFKQETHDLTLRLRETAHSSMIDETLFLAVIGISQTERNIRRSNNPQKRRKEIEEFDKKKRWIESRFNQVWDELRAWPGYAAYCRKLREATMQREHEQNNRLAKVS